MSKTSNSQTPKRKTTTLLLPACLSLLVCLLLAGCSSSDDTSTGSGLQEQVEVLGGDASERELVQRHAPILKLKRHDPSTNCRAGEPFDPGPVSLVLEQEGVELKPIVGAGPPIQRPTATDLRENDPLTEARGGPVTFLDWPGEHRRPGCAYVTAYQTLREELGERPVVYARIATESGRDELVLQYFFFYYYNDFINKHEGDWEMIQLIFEEGSVESALLASPDRVTYSGHGGGQKANWDDSALETDGSRPVVYVAEGSHANYFRPGRYVGAGAGKEIVGCETSEGSHRTLAALDVVLLPDPVSDEFAWLDYAGLWGAWDADPIFSGITGPKLSDEKWQRPVSWDEELAINTARVPPVGGAAFGPNPLTTLCAASGFLATVHFPWPLNLMIGVVIVFLVAVLVLAFLAPIRWLFRSLARLTARLLNRAATSRARHRPPKRLPKARRPFGLIGPDAVYYYRRDFWTFFRVGVFALAVSTALLVLGLLVDTVVGLDAASLTEDALLRTLIEFGLGAAWGLFILLIMESAAAVVVGTRQEVLMEKIPAGSRPSLSHFHSGPKAIVIARLLIAYAMSVGVPTLLLAGIVGIWTVHLTYGLEGISYLLSFLGSFILLGSAALLWARQLFVVQRCLLYPHKTCSLKNVLADFAVKSAEVLEGKEARYLGVIAVGMVMLVFPSLLLGVGFLRIANGWDPYLLLGLNAVLYTLVLCPMFFIGKLLFYNDLATMLERHQKERGAIQEGVTTAKVEVNRRAKALARTFHSGES